MCKTRQIVYRCFKACKDTNCRKKFCQECLTAPPYSIQIKEILRSQKEWSCPFKLDSCICSKCRHCSFESAQRTYTTKAGSTSKSQSPSKKPSAPKSDFEEQFKQAYDSLFIDTTPDRKSDQSSQMSQQSHQSSQPSATEAPKPIPKSEASIYKLRLLNNQLSRFIADPHTKLRQGALEFNAYIIKNLLLHLQDPDLPITEEEYAFCLDLLYLNLKKLSQNCDLAMTLNLMNHQLKKKIKIVLAQGDKEKIDFNELRLMATEM